MTGRRAPPTHHGGHTDAFTIVVTERSDRVADNNDGIYRSDTRGIVSVPRSRRLASR